MEQINVDALMELARSLLPPQLIVICRPEDAEKTHEMVAGTPHADIIEVVESPEIPEGHVILMRKGHEEWTL